MADADAWEGAKLDIWTTLLLGLGAATAAAGSSDVAQDREYLASIMLAEAAVLTLLRLRLRPPRTPMLRYGGGLALALGLIAAVLAAVGPPMLMSRRSRQRSPFLDAVRQPRRVQGRGPGAAGL